MEKIIHCCWFGRGEKSALIKKCMNTWKEKLPEYLIIEWNEDNFDIESNLYVKEAYASRKWAFVSDYVRLWALYNHGGIYLDTDVEVFKPFDDFLEHRFFTGFEKHCGEISPITAVMGSEKNSVWLKEMLDEYEHISFIQKDGTHNLYTNTKRITKYMIDELGVDKEDDRIQNPLDGFYIYPSHYFCNKKSDSYSMHHFDGSWLPLHSRLKKKFLGIIK
ncbi:glycosyl transferase [Vibrio cholerae]|uniref:glycosyltransferase family 32 protein n=1 Tax=Vibrio cholerae TaxID=666 RepID=UPI0011D34B65|nr:glycosyltransferase [Vibrio cholerae]TXZ91856.1 glycosyl transferase [Vibrio cholerae]BCN17178.1 putative glycosyltransferase [Vibrio cholerae]GHY67718.1 glycosyl transferase [Vibrio cholerae]